VEPIKFKICRLLLISLLQGSASEDISQNEYCALVWFELRRAHFKMLPII